MAINYEPCGYRRNERRTVLSTRIKGVHGEPAIVNGRPTGNGLVGNKDGRQQGNEDAATRRTSALRFLPRRWSAWQRGGFKTPSPNVAGLGGQCVFGATNLSMASTFENNSGSAWQTATVPEREVRKIATEYLRPLNQGLESLGSATNFEHFIETIYKPVVKPLMATTSTVNQPLSHESRDQIRDVLSSALRFAVQHDLLVRSPAEPRRIAPDKRGKKRNKPYLTPRQFDALVELIAEPHASMVYVAIYNGTAGQRTGRSALE